MKVGPSKVAAQIAFYKEDWEYLKWLSQKTGQNAGAFVRELTHEVVGFLRSAIPMDAGKEDLDVRRFLRTTFGGMSNAFEELEKMFQEERVTKGKNGTAGQQSEP